MTLATTAPHEAAHVVVALAMGLDVEEVTTIATERVGGFARLHARPILGWRGDFGIATTCLAGVMGEVILADTPIAEAYAHGSRDRELAAPRMEVVGRALGMTPAEVERLVCQHAGAVVLANREAIETLAGVLQRVGELEQPRLGAFLRELHVERLPIPCVDCAECGLCKVCDPRVSTAEPHDCRPFARAQRAAARREERAS